MSDKYIIEGDTLADIADAIRLKRDMATEINPEDMALQIGLIESGGGGYTVEDILTGNIAGMLTITGNPTKLVPYAFASQPITSVNAPEWIGVYATNLGYTFFNCAQLSSVNAPMLKNVAPHMFEGCKSLTRIKLPRDNQKGAAVFSNCTALRIADLAWTSMQGDQLFLNCTNLDTLILRHTAVCPINPPTYWAFPLKGTKFDTASGTVYVPSSLISSYQTATNWSTLYDAGKVVFSPLEEAPTI